MAELPEPERVFWHNVDPERGHRFYTDRRDGDGVAVWEARAETLERYPSDVKMVRIIRPGEPTIAQLKALHAREIELARSMAAAHERTVMGEAVRVAEQRASGAERSARATVEAQERKLRATQGLVDNELHGWDAVLDRFIAMADRVGAIWGEGEVGTDEATAWVDVEDGSTARHFTSVALERVLERLEGILAEEHPSVAYPFPADGVVAAAEANLRAAIGSGRDLTDAVRDMLADAAKRNRSA